MLKIETFENESLIFNFTGDWERTTQRAYEGNYSYGSKNISHSQESNAYLTVTTDYIEFYWYVSSESSYDYFEFYIDGNREIRQSGTSGWNKFSKSLTKEEHTFHWKYYKDGSVDRGDDRAYIDNLILNIGESRYFIEDEGVLKVWNGTNQQYDVVQIIDEQTQELVDLTPDKLTDEIFLNYGMETLKVSRAGLVDLRPKIYYFTNEDEIVNQPEGFCLKLIETVKSLPKIVVENTGRILEQTISSITIDDTVSGTGDLQYALSKDKNTWYVFDTTNKVWQVVDITNDTDFAAKGMRKEDFEVITEAHYEEIFKVGDELYLAFRFYKGEETDECKFKGVKINYTSPLDIII
ncbi:hypothetical protein Y919_02525 [Caloranaerobacter azorensis H53214]|uniref:Uncharacterized protein n=1 Tax=Caloranaerobacter azorensis H53214 TaxID=1156417 RepID=A0A096BIS8_9FIRM|nr:hypothetical protein [Caloranaerobacter azorensis]KGG81065.1 hypothetical protein Y919_02525 [Caloranaerobacter azorensis H53214]